MSFVARLSETNAWLDGFTQETGTAGDARGLTISATLQGRRTGHSVTFLKLYTGSHRGYDSVHYAGAVNADGTEIAGRWTVPGSWSGTFVMTRSAGSAAARTREVAEQV